MDKQPLKISDKATLVFLGPPGSGKGTQAGMISRELGIPRIAPGDLGRAEIAKGTRLGLLIKPYYDGGYLAPVELVSGIIKKRLAKKDARRGSILDGYPRKMEQVSGLEKMTRLDVVVAINISDQEAVRRLAGRRVCGQCGINYHLRFNPPEKKGVCGQCGGKIWQREDDTPKVVRRRLKIYRRETEKVLEYFRKAGKLIEINGEQPIEKVRRDIGGKLKRRLRARGIN